MLLLCMRPRYATIAVTLALFALAVVGLRFVQQQFFPASDRPELVVDLSLPQNATITATETAAEALEKLLTGDPKIDRFSVYVGARDKIVCSESAKRESIAESGHPNGWPGHVVDSVVPLKRGGRG